MEENSAISQNKKHTAIKFEAFVLDSTIECLVNDPYGFSFGAQNYPKCAVGSKVAGGVAEVLKLKVKTH